MRITINNFFVIIMLTLTLIIAGCSSNGSNDNGKEKSKTIKVANFYADDHPVNKALNEKFKKIVEEKTDNNLEVEIHSNSALGGEEEMWDSLRNGTLEMAEIGVIMEPEVPKVSILTLPFLFEDYDHAQKVLNGDVGQQISEQIEEKAPVKFLAYGINGFRSFSSTDPIEKMDDFKGYKLRSANIPQLLAMSESLGATVSPMPISEIFSSLEQGVIDGQENPISTLKSNGWYEVQDYVLESQHVFLPNEIMVNLEFWEGLTDEEQTIIEDAAKESAEYEWDLFIEEEEEVKEFLEQEGVTITEPDEQFTNEMIEATKGVYENFYEDNSWGKEVVDQIKEEK